jgi:hypothetical protein
MTIDISRQIPVPRVLRRRCMIHATTITKKTADQEVKSRPAKNTIQNRYALSQISYSGRNATVA